ncbi:Cell division protein FtsH [Minicystis rosea]|nr:Cell division protein FtsH [Minicystis rosea]
MDISIRAICGGLGVAALVAACSANGGGNVFTSSDGDTGGAGHGGSATGTKSTGTGAGDVGGGDISFTTSGTGTGTGNTCNHAPDADGDGDGWTANEGDCNDCDPNVNPGAIEVVATDPNAPPADENCDGMIDNVEPTCDDGLALDDVNPLNGARAVDLCKIAEETPASKKDKTWGVIGAQYVRANGTAYAAPGYQVGLQAGWGPNVHPQGGTKMLAISSGRARLPGQTGECGDNSCPNNSPGQAPPGFPQDVAGCDGSTVIKDDVALQVKIRTPTNATGYSFAFNFYSFEYPEFVCTLFNDQFISLVDPAPNGSVSGNISFDSNHNPVSVNVAFFNVCDPCPLGTAQLAGTGFDGAWYDDGGATGWLKSQAPVKGGDVITIRWTIWDTGDQSWDSTALVDNFQWIANGGTVSVGTDPINMPK